MGESSMGEQCIRRLFATSQGKQRRGLISAIADRHDAVPERGRVAVTKPPGAAGEGGAHHKNVTDAEGVLCYIFEQAAGQVRRCHGDVRATSTALSGRYV